MNLPYSNHSLNILLSTYSEFYCNNLAKHPRNCHQHNINVQKRLIGLFMFLRCSPAAVMSDGHPLRPVSSAAEIDHLHLLSEQLGALVPGEEYSDVTFIVEEKPFPAHRVILAARCQYFR